MPFRNRKTSVCSDEDLFAPIANANTTSVRRRRRPQVRFIEERNYEIEMMHRDEDCLADLSPEKKENIRRAGFKKKGKGSSFKLSEAFGKENMESIT